MNRRGPVLLFWLGFSLLIAHEMDAMVRHEWRMLPGFSAMANDASARDLFTLAHVPLFAALLWLCSHPTPRLRLRTQRGVDVFLVLHASVHALLSGHALYEFVPPVETVTVYGAGLAGGLHLWASLRGARHPERAGRCR